MTDTNIRQTLLTFLKERGGEGLTSTEARQRMKWATTQQIEAALGGLRRDELCERHQFSTKGRSRVRYFARERFSAPEWGWL
jgi:hypothetical protein